jgi:NurA-like 5'-3' nuclease
MTLTPFLYVAGGTVFIVLLLVLLRMRKASDLSHRYWEAMQAENNGEEDRAIGLYQDALNRSRKMMSGDKKLKGDIEQRLKTLVISRSFEKSFRDSKVAVL